VVCDRFSDSTTAYQGYGRGLDLATIDAINGSARRAQADLTILLIWRHPEHWNGNTPKRMTVSILTIWGFITAYVRAFWHLPEKEAGRWVVIKADHL
jgi:dTMP kinase